MVFIAYYWCMWWVYYFFYVCQRKCADASARQYLWISRLFLYSVIHLFSILLQLPAVVAVVNHLAGHAAVNADVFACDKTSFVAAKE